MPYIHNIPECKARRRNVFPANAWVEDRAKLALKFGPAFAGGRTVIRERGFREARICDRDSSRSVPADERTQRLRSRFGKTPAPDIKETIEQTAKCSRGEPCEVTSVSR